MKTLQTTPDRKRPFELTFWGGTRLAYIRWHETEWQARDEARRIHEEMDNPNAHPGIIYGPGLGRDGLTV